MNETNAPYIRYSDSVEEAQPDEDKTISEIIASFDRLPFLYLARRHLPRWCFRVSGLGDQGNRGRG